VKIELVGLELSGRHATILRAHDIRAHVEALHSVGAVAVGP
jgi:hypothetical protein